MDSIPPPRRVWTAGSILPVRPRHWPWIWLATAALLYTPWIDTEVGQGNVASDLAAIESLAERGTFFIDGSTFEGTIDKFKRGDRYFSQKSPVFHLVAVLPYLGLRAMELRLATDTALCLRVLTFFLSVLPMGWLLWLIFDHPWMRLRGLRARVALTLGFALGSLLTPFAVTLNHYILASACLMAAVNALTEASVAGRAPNERLGIMVGFWTSASLACDVPPAFIFAAALALFWAWKGRRALAGLALGAAPLVALYAALNFAIIGSPLPPNLHEREMLYYDGSYWKEMEAKAEKFGPGYYQASYPRRLGHSSLGFKGIYWMMPLLAVATVRALGIARRRESGAALAASWAIFPIVTIAVTMRWAIDLSGGAYGIRHAFAPIPPLYCVLALGDWPRTRRGRALAVMTGAWGCLVATIGVMNPWSHNTLSAIPPLENLARSALHHADRLPTDWIPPLIARTSVDPANAWLDLGLERLAGKRLAEAEEALRRAIESNPAIPLPYYHLGIVLDMRGRSPEAIRVYRRLLELEPSNVGAWNNLGLFALKAGRLDDAREAYARSLALAPDNASGLWGQLVIEELDGQADPGSARLAEALRLHPHDARLQDLARRWRSLPPP